MTIKAKMLQKKILIIYLLFKIKYYYLPEEENNIKIFESNYNLNMKAKTKKNFRKMFIIIIIIKKIVIVNLKLILI